MSIDLNREMDRVKSKVFMGSSSAFLGSIMCSLNFSWDETIPTACTDGLNLKFNPEFFMSIPPDTRKTVLLHELWHVAKMHSIRRGDRDPKVWNEACDIRINNDLEREGQSFIAVEKCWKDQSVDNNGILCEEQIYDLLNQGKIHKPKTGSWGDQSGQGDLEETIEITNVMKQQIINVVAQAVQQATLAGQAGSIPGGIKSTLDGFLAPIIPWTYTLYQFFTELEEENYSYKHVNRRYLALDMVMPGKYKDESKLADLTYFIDVSGSITDDQVLRCNSEIKYIQQEIKPGKLTVIQFDTEIQDIRVFLEDEPFDKIEIIGRGGTCLRCVKKYIDEHKPTAAVIFSDLECDPMVRPKDDIPIIWVVLSNYGFKPTFGKVIKIN